MPADNTAPIWFRGVWKREWMKDGASAPLEDRIVRDVQTPSIFGSVRVPLSRPKISAKSFDELDDAQLHALLEQKGFAGTATFAGHVATWRHDIDFRPPNDVDTARISQQTATMVLEEGLDGSFSELWWNLAPGETRFLGIEERRNGRVEQILSVVGDHFVYARNRAHVRGVERDAFAPRQRRVHDHPRRSATVHEAVREFAVEQRADLRA